MKKLKIVVLLIILSYSLTVLGKNGSKEPENILLTTQIIIQPSFDESSLCPGDGFDLSVEAVGNKLSYQWFLDGNAIPGETSEILSISSVSITDAGEYTVLVTDDMDNEFISNPVNLTILESVAITVQPLNFSNCIGRSAALSVEAIGTDLHYQWFLNNRPLPVSSSVLYIPNLDNTDEGGYTVSVTGTCGSEVSEVANISVANNVIPQVSLFSPSSVCLGSDITFTALSANGGETPFFEFVDNNTGATITTSSLNTITIPANNQELDIGVIMTTSNSLCIEPGASSTVRDNSVVQVVTSKAPELISLIPDERNFTVLESIESISIMDPGNGFQVEWSLISLTNLGTATLNSPTSFSTGVRNLDVNNPYFITATLSDIDGVCPDSSISFEIERVDISIPVAPEDTNICASDLPLNLVGNAVNTSIETSFWIDVDGANGMPGARIPAQTIVVSSTIPIQENNASFRFRYEIENESALTIFSDEVLITIHKELEDTVTITNDLNGNDCSNFINDFTLSSSLTDDSFTYQWFENGTPVANNSSIITLNSPGLIDTREQNLYTLEISNGACPSIEVEHIVPFQLCVGLDQLITGTGNSNSFFNFEGLEKYSEITLEVFDLSGNRLHQFLLNPKELWTADNLSNGAYIYQLKFGLNQQRIGRLTVQR